MPPTSLIPLKKLEALQELYPEHEWIAMDEDGESTLYADADEPICWADSDRNWWSGSPVCDGRVQIEVLDNYAPDWKNSLIHIPTEIERLKGLEGGQ